MIGKQIPKNTKRALAFQMTPEHFQSDCSKAKNVLQNIWPYRDLQ